jgi:hypothetical protein
LGSIGAYLRYLGELLKLVALCRRLELYFFSTQSDLIYVFSAAVIARLKGVAIVLHDYRFHSGRGKHLTKTLYSLSRQVEIGDISAVVNSDRIPADYRFRCDVTDPAPYRNFRKSRAIPRVLVYGDFERPRIHYLVNHTHKLVKQKYPRTEFILILPTSTGDRGINIEDSASSVSLVPPGSENELRRQFEDCDTIMLLSPGGLNRLFAIRARYAGYPVITNGFECPHAGPDVLTVPRDSYSSLAEAVIRLVDDETYYRGFSPG